MNATDYLGTGINDLRNICMTPEEQQQLINIVNAHTQQALIIGLGIGFLCGLIAGAVYIYITWYHGRD